MIAQILLSALLGGLLVYAAKTRRRTRSVSWLSAVVALAGLYIVWVPAHATVLAEWVGIGRGADLVLYIWAAVSLIILLNLYLKLRSQLELTTVLARHIALSEARGAAETTEPESQRFPSQQRRRSAIPRRTA
jgi:hypothetical protein